MNVLRALLRSFVAGAAAGLCAFVVDWVLARLTLGYPLPVEIAYAVAYAAAGAVLGILFGGGVILLRRQPMAFLLAFSTPLAVLYAGPIFERVHHILASRAGQIPAVGGAMVAVVGYGVWNALLRRLLPPELSWTAFLIGAMTAAFGLALNSNVVARPLEPAALIVDALVLLASVLVAVSVRLFDPKRATAAWAILVLAIFVLVMLAPRSEESAPAVSTQDPKPNLVLVVIDTLRQDVFRSVVEETEEGQRFREALDGAAWFNNAIAAAPWTAPSMGSIMTGLYPSEHGFGRSSPEPDPGRPIERLHDSVTTLAEHLAERGYFNAALVTNPLLDPATGVARGFATYEVLHGPTAKLPILRPLARIGLVRPHPYQRAESMCLRLTSLLERLSSDGRPLFLWLHLMDPHAPLMLHQDLSSDPTGKTLAGPDRLYRDEVRYSLRELAQAFEVLRSHGLWDQTLLILASDHGEMFPSDNHRNGVLRSGRVRRGGHGHALYGELVRVPQVIRPPGGLPSEREIDVLTSHVDLFDTITDLLHLDLPRIAGDRVSLARWLDGDPTDAYTPGRRSALVSANNHGPRQRALRNDRFKLVVYPDGQRESELYDITLDPGEQRNLADEDPGSLQEVTLLLERSWARLRPSPRSEGTKYDPETQKRLRALGYLE